MRKRTKRSVKRSNIVSIVIAISLTMGLFFLILGFVYYTSNANRDFCANSISCIEDLSGEKVAEDKGLFMGQYVDTRDAMEDGLLAYENGQIEESSVLADQAGDYKRIYVDLTNQRLYAFEGNTMVMDVPVSTGKIYPTPTGDFRIWIWLRYTRMSGGSGAGYYNLPNVPFTMYLYNDQFPKFRGYAVHGAYWHNNFGNPMSHGCVNMRIEDAQKLFYWTNPSAGGVSYANDSNPGTLVTIYGRTPSR